MLVDLFMRLRFPLLVFIGIGLIALLHFYKISDFPPGFHIDEVTMGWNAYSLLKTGRDENGWFLPLYSRSFGLDRALGNFLVTALSINFLGLTEQAVRLPFAMAGMLTVVVMYFFTKEFIHSRILASLAAFFLGISPWHLDIVRASSEASISLLLILLGQLLFIKGVRDGKTLFIIGSTQLAFSSLFFYHAAPPFVAVSFLILAIFCFYTTHEYRTRKVLTAATITLLLCITGYFYLSKGGVSRFSQVGFHKDPIILNEQEKMFYEEGTNNTYTARLFHNKLVTYARGFLSNYSKYVTIDYLFLHGGKPPRYTPPAMGLLYIYFLPLFMIGIYYLLKEQPKTAYPVLLLLLLSPITGAVTYEYSPNVQRTYFMMPYIALVTAHGLDFLKPVLLKRKLLMFIGMGFVFASTIYYLHQYYIHFAVHEPLYRNDGVKELVLKVAKESTYTKIIFTTHPEQPYHYFLFFNAYDPHRFQENYTSRKDAATGWWLDDKYFFSKEDCPSQKFTDISDGNILYIDSSECPFGDNEKKLYKQIDVVKRKDGSVIYRLLERMSQ